MLEVLMWTVVCLIGLIGLIGCVLAVPVDLSARVDLYDRLRGSFQFGWLFGAVTVRKDLRRKKRAPEEESKAQKKKRGGRVPSGAVLRRGLHLVGDLLRRVRVRHATLDISVGTEDPAATGELAGMAAPVVALANTLPGTRVTYRPDFRGPMIEGQAEGAIRFVPIALVPPVIRFVLSPEVRQWRRKRG